MQLVREARAAQRKIDLDLAVSEGRLQVRQMTAAERAVSDLRRGERAAENAGRSRRSYSS
jgi:hypothetical protein